MNRKQAKSLHETLRTSSNHLDLRFLVYEEQLQAKYEGQEHYGFELDWVLGVVLSMDILEALCDLQRLGRPGSRRSPLMRSLFVGDLRRKT
ncbi:hypothetical protein DVH24_027528 [Malus domestica]|uniref:Uncharacterized protein n=1 Tax=Malus domestica TaxID=3750 RepID=A0A498HE15_MALDO|nr:hypothetical protein DVH24_027528 [Malus domestica]